MSTPQQQQRRRRRQLWGKQVSKQASNQSINGNNNNNDDKHARKEDRGRNGSQARRGDCSFDRTRQFGESSHRFHVQERVFLSHRKLSLSLSLRRKMRDTCSVVARGITVGGDDDGVWLGGKLRKDKGCSTRNGQRRSRLRHVVCVCLCVCVGKWRL